MLHLVRRALPLLTLGVAVLTAAAPSAGAQPVTLPGHTRGQPEVFTNGASFVSYAGLPMFQLVCQNTLDALPDGTTEIAFGRPTGPSGGVQRPQCNTGTLVGAVVEAGRITSASTFSVTFALPTTGFGLYFGTSAGGIGSLSFFRNGSLLHTVTRDLAATDNQFLGALYWEPTRFDRVDVGFQGSGTFTADNLMTTTPEPTTWALMGTGLLALGGVASRRRRTVS